MQQSPISVWNVFAGGALAVIVAVSALGIALIQAQRRRRALQLTYAQRLLNAQEEERARVAREVHDDALQRVAMIRHEVESFSRSDLAPKDPDAQRRLAAIAEEIADLSVTLRTVAHELHPSLIGSVGLPRALDALAADYQRTDGLAVALDVPDHPLALKPDAALSLYRITQEALRNVIKHAGVREARVTLSTDNGKVVLTIRDNGKGFAAAPGRTAASLGLTSMKERAGIAGGRVSVTSAPDRGTTVQVTVPHQALA